jgi:hypothetical protein
MVKRMLREQMEVWRGRKVIVHYFPGNGARSVLIVSEQGVNPNVDITG